MYWHMKPVSPLYSSPTETRTAAPRLFRPIHSDFASHPDFMVNAREFSEKRLPLGSKDAVIVEAVALQVPGWTEEAIWRDPFTLDEVGRQQLQDLGAPDWLTEAASSKSNPVLSVLMRVEGVLPAAHARFSRAIDSRTSMPVQRQDHDLVYEVNEDRWTRLAIPLGIWHDTPLKIWLPLVAGVPISSGPLESGRYEMVAGSTKVEIYDLRNVSRTERNLPIVSSTISTNLNRAHCGIIAIQEGGKRRIDWLVPSAPRGETNLFEGIVTPDLRGIGILNDHFFGARQAPFDPVRFEWIYLPEYHPFEIEIAGLPDMPNGRDVANLFEVWIPKIATDDPFRAGLAAAEMYFSPAHSYRSVTPIGQPKSMPPLAAFERTYQDITAYELLGAAAEQWSKPPNFQAESGFVVTPYEPLPWTQQLRNWWDERAPDWMR